MNSSSLSGEIDWYFDYISPFAYLQFVLLTRAQADNPEIVIRYRPLLFAGLLGAHGHKGPAEIPIKRLMTYRYCHWLAQQHNIPFAMPAAHPFNPLPLLRSTVALDNDPHVIQTLFEHCWVNSADDLQFATIERLNQLPGLASAQDHYDDPAIKQRLRDNTDRAVEGGLFGVPTIAIGDDLFWGVDMTPMALDRLGNPGLLEQTAYQRIDQLPVGTARS